VTARVTGYYNFTKCHCTTTRTTNICICRPITDT